MPLRWIEEAEARQVLAAALDEVPQPRFRYAVARPSWAARLRRWFTATPAYRAPPPRECSKTPSRRRFL
jgi:hypothetical protein